MTRPNIFPVLRYQDAPAAIDWLVRSFGFEKIAVHANADGSVAHAELRIGTAVIGLSSAHSQPGNPWSDVRTGLYVHVDAIDAHHDRAKAAGADIVSPLKDMDYGSREYGAKDSGGHLWGFGTYRMANADGEPAIFPELHYHDGAAAIAFLTRAFGFETKLSVPAPDGHIVHAELAFGPGIVMVGSGDEGAETWGSQKQAQHVWVEDPDRHFAAAKSAGAKILQPPRDTPWGSRGYYVRDVEGLLWGFSNYRPGRLKASPAARP
jgi:uncharacterized glyoxalase superfamily protein PhnB